MPKKGAAREEFTLGLLEKFKKKLVSIKEQQPSSEDASEPKVNEDDAWYALRITEFKWYCFGNLRFVYTG